jgi:hypothetical protein
MGLFDDLLPQAQPRAPVAGMPPGWQPGDPTPNAQPAPAAPPRPYTPPERAPTYGRSVVDAITQFGAGFNKSIAPLVEATSYLSPAGAMHGAVAQGADAPSLGDMFRDLTYGKAGEPLSDAGYIANKAGHTVGQVLPMTAGGIGMAATVPARLISQPSMASTTIGRIGDTILRSAAQRPLATTAYDVASGIGSGAAGGAYDVGGGTDKTTRALFELAGGTTPAIYGTVGPLAAATMPLTRSGRETIREGVAGARDLGSKIGKVVGIPTAEDRAQAAIKAELQKPGVADEAARVAQLGDVIEGFQPTLAQRTGTQSMLRTQKDVEGRMSGDVLDQAAGIYDQNVGAITKRIAAGPAGEGMTGSPERVASAVTDKYTGLDKRLAAKATQAAGQRDVIQEALPTTAADRPGPTYDAARAGERLTASRDKLQKDMLGDAKNPAPGTVRARYDAVDPDGTFSVPVDDVRSALQRDIDSMTNAFSGAPDTASRVQRFLRTGSEDEGSQVLDASGRAMQAAPKMATFNDFQKYRSALLGDIRDLEASAVRNEGTTEKLRVLRAAVGNVDNALTQWSTKFDPDMRKRYDDANAYYRDEYVPRFKQGVSGQMDNVDKTGGSKISREDIPKKFFGGESEAAQFQRVYGKDKDAVQTMTDHALASLRDGVGDRPMTQAAIDRWKAKHSRVLERIPDVRKAIDAIDLKNVEQTMATAQGRREVLAKSDLVKRLGDPDKTIDEALNNPRAMRLLRRSVRGDRDAEGALADATWRRVAGTGDNLPSYDQVSKILDDPKKVESLRLALSPKAMSDLKAIRDAIEVQGRVTRPGGSAEDMDTSLFAKLKEATGVQASTAVAAYTGIARGRSSPVVEAANLATRFLSSRSSKEADALRQRILWDGRLRDDMAELTQTGRMKPEGFKRLHSYLLTVGQDDEKKE